MSIEVTIKGTYLFAVDTDNSNVLHDYPLKDVLIQKFAEDGTSYTFSDNRGAPFLKNIAIADIVSITGEFTSGDALSFEGWYTSAIGVSSGGYSSGSSSGFDLAIAEILKFDSTLVSVSQKAKTLIKFGANNNLSAGVEETVWLTGGDETYAVGNTIDEAVSTSASDVGALRIEGHTLSGGEFTFVVQTVTLNGVTPVSLPTPLARVTRASNESSSNLVGIVTVEDNTSGLTHITLSPSNNDNQSLKCSTTISKDDYWLITSIVFSIDDSNTGKDVVFKLKVRSQGGVFQTKFREAVSVNGGGQQIIFEEPIIIRPNSDVYISAKPTSNNTAVSASIHGQMAVKI